MRRPAGGAGLAAAGVDVAAVDSRALQSAFVLTVVAATEATSEIIEAVGRMLPLLSRSSPAPGAREVAEIIDSPSTTLFIARDGEDGPIVGTLTLAVFRIPTGVRAVDRRRDRDGRSPRPGLRGGPQPGGDSTRPQPLAPARST